MPQRSQCFGAEERSQPDVLTAHGENHWQQFGLLEALMFHFADDLDSVCFAQGCHSVATSDGDCARQGPGGLQAEGTRGQWSAAESTLGKFTEQ